MKIKNLLANVVAILTVITLIGGFQINAAEQVTTVTETVIGVDEAYAGPCADRGCQGVTTDLCETYNVLEIGNMTFTRKCRGVKPLEDDDQPEDVVPIEEGSSL